MKYVLSERTCHYMKDRNCAIFQDGEICQTTVDDLKHNPIFAMSLGSKELFHSNFLEWLLTDETLKDKTKGLRHLLIGSSEQKNFHVYREKYNFDLLIANGEETEDELKNKEIKYTVIENKFKSMPRNTVCMMAM